MIVSGPLNAENAMDSRRMLSACFVIKTMRPPTISWHLVHSRARSRCGSSHRRDSSILGRALIPPWPIGGCRLGLTSRRHSGADSTPSSCSSHGSYGKSTTGEPSTVSRELPYRSSLSSVRKQTPVSPPGSGPLHRCSPRSHRSGPLP
jgi:hypothetical protein